MDRQAAEQRIAQTVWYHEIDFGNGLKATPHSQLDFHRKVWSLIERNLARIDFRGKSVLDLGCWDGAWSFYAEKRGARHVVASDDATQNWAGSQGLLLAKELLNSSVEPRLDVSVHDLSGLPRFDVILFMGIYYHLHDPFHALAQIRHRCHPGTLVVVEGDAFMEVEEPMARLDYSDHSCPLFYPSRGAMRNLAQAAYLSVTHQDAIDTSPSRKGPEPEPDARLGWRWRLRMCLEALRGSWSGVRRQAALITPPPSSDRKVGRQILFCKPFEGANPAHLYKPPFGLDAYDSRFRAKAAA
jgi:tRNA (mo5U34)-methyltransferase